MTWRRGDLIFWWPLEARKARRKELYVPCIATSTRHGYIVRAVTADGAVVEGDESHGRRPQRIYGVVVTKSALTIPLRKLLPKLAASYSSLNAVREALAPYRRKESA